MTELPHQEFLFTVAELGAAFVGFSLVVSVFRPTSPSQAVRTGSFRDVAEIGLSTIAGAFAPYVLHHFGFPLDSVWRFSSLLLAVGGFVAFAFGFWRFQQLGGALPWKTAPMLSASTGGLYLASSALLWWNVIAPGPSSSARYVLALLLLLGMAGALFVFAAFERTAPDAT